MAYSVDDIDEYGAVKPGVGITLSSIFLMRQLLYAPLLLVANRRGRGSSGANIDMSFIEIYSILELVACIPAFLVVIALFRRKPDAGQRVRNIASRSKTLLLFSASLHMVALAYVIFVESNQNGFLIITALISLYILIYLLRSTRLTDVIAKFPGD